MKYRTKSFRAHRPIDFGHWTFGTEPMQGLIHAHMIRNALTLVLNRFILLIHISYFIFLVSLWYMKNTIWNANMFDGWYPDTMSLALAKYEIYLKVKQTKKEKYEMLTKIMKYIRYKMSDLQTQPIAHNVAKYKLIQHTSAFFVSLTLLF